MSTAKCIGCEHLSRYHAERGCSYGVDDLTVCDCPGFVPVTSPTETSKCNQCMFNDDGSVSAACREHYMAEAVRRGLAHPTTPDANKESNDVQSMLDMMGGVNHPYDLLEPYLWRDKLGDSLWHCELRNTHGIYLQVTGTTPLEALENIHEKISTQYE